MSQRKTFMFFITKVVQRELRAEQLRTDAALQETLSLLFESQRNKLLAKDAVPITYAPGDECDEGDVFVIRDYKTPPEIQNAKKKQDVLDVFAMKGQSEKVRSIFAVADSGEIMLQRFTDRQRLTGKFQITLSKDTFRKQSSAGLLVGDQLAAVITSDGLFFSKFEQAKAVLPNLSDFFAEATSKQLIEFARHPLLHVENAASFAARTTSWHRRRIAALQTERIMDRLSAGDVQSRAKRYGLHLEVRPHPKNKKLQIVLPEDRDGLKMAIKLLSNELLLSELTNERFAVPAKRKLSPRK